MQLAPIVLFVYNRPFHVRQTLEALSKNELADQSELYIYADGFKEGESREQHNKVLEVRKIIREKNWCKSVLITEAPKNRGLADSVIGGVSDILTKHENIIVIEDDVITSPYFLKFMNEALAFFENEPKVLSIGSWNYFTDLNVNPDNFFMQMPDTIAWATWRRSWNLFQYDAGLLLKKLRKRRLIKSFNMKGRFDFEKMLIAQINSEINSWGIRWTAVAALHHTLTFYPKISLTKHIGFGEDSTHSMLEDYNKNLTLADEPIRINAIELKESKQAVDSWISFEKNIKKANNLLKKSFFQKLTSLFQQKLIKFSLIKSRINKT